MKKLLLVIVSTMFACASTQAAIIPGAGPVVLKTDEIMVTGTTFSSPVVFPFETGNFLVTPIMPSFSDPNGTLAEGLLKANVETHSTGMEFDFWSRSRAITGTQFRELTVENYFDLCVPFCVNWGRWRLEAQVDQQDFGGTPAPVPATVKIICVDPSGGITTVWQSTHLTNSISIEYDTFLDLDPANTYKLKVEGFINATSTGNIEDRAYLDIPYFRLTCVPEPSSIVLAGVGAVGLAAAIRRRRRA